MENQFMNSGEVAIIDSTTIEISELPVKSWTQVSCLSFIPVLRGIYSGTEFLSLKTNAGLHVLVDFMPCSN